jgi:predicted nucleic acid-binding protein
LAHREISARCFDRNPRGIHINVAERLANRYTGVEYEGILGLIVQNTEPVQAADLPEPVSEDPNDDKFLACALASNTRIIVSDDSDLLKVSGYADIRVLTPKAFVSEFLDQSC